MNKVRNGAFQNTERAYVSVELCDDCNISSCLKARQNAILLNKNPKNCKPHLTLYQFDINLDNPNAFIFRDKMSELAKFAFECYKKTFIRRSVQLKYTQGEYDLMGQSKHKFLVKKYDLYPRQDDVIVEFQKKFCDGMEAIFDLGSSKINKGNDFEYHSYNKETKALFAVPNFYAEEKWRPHVSLVNTADVKEHNPSVYRKYENAKEKELQIEALMEPIYKKQFAAMEDINMTTNIKSVKLSVGEDYEINYFIH